MITKSSLAGILLLAAAAASFGAAASGTAQKAADSSRKPGASAANSHATQPTSAGERIFEQNCSRCHTAPESFPPSISGTIIRHMRLRANLSQHDEQELLKYLNP